MQHQQIPNISIILCVGQQFSIVSSDRSWECSVFRGWWFF